MYQFLEILFYERMSSVRRNAKRPLQDLNMLLTVKVMQEMRP